LQELQYAIEAFSLGSLYALIALGISLVFGIMRLINFAYGELIMGSAFAIYLVGGQTTSPPWYTLIPVAVGTGAVLALLMERVAFRPIRGASPTTLLVTSFAVSYLLQNVALLKFGSAPKGVLFPPVVTQQFIIGDNQLIIRKLDVITSVTTIVLFFALTLFLKRTGLGVRLRASAEDFRMARILGVHANTVVATAFVISGGLAGVVAILYGAQLGAVSPTMGLAPLLIGLVATVIGGMGSLVGAVVGGYVLGGATEGLNVGLPVNLAPFRDAFLFGLVILILLLRPEGLVAGRAVRLRGSTLPLTDAARWRMRFRRMRSQLVAPRPRIRGRRLTLPHVSEQHPTPVARALVLRLWPLVAPAALVVIVTAIIASFAPEDVQSKGILMLINLVFVLGLYVFVGNSGVLSFGHASFMALGAYTSALITAEVHIKHTLLPNLPGWLLNAHVATIPATLLAAAVAAAFALTIGGPLMRLTGLAAGIATLAMLQIVYTVITQWVDLTGGLTAINQIPTDTGIYTALVWALIVMAVVYLVQESPLGLRLRGSREDELAARSVGIGVVGERLAAFVASAAIVGIAGALYAHFLGSITADLFYFQITFLTIAMLVVGGINSLSGAVIGTVFISVLQEGLRRLEVGPNIGFWNLPASPGLTEVGLALVMLATLLLRPGGITGSREIVWPFSKWSTGRSLPAEALREEADETPPGSLPARSER
jgi:branched-subunit amino acid ABC-type transport system permease component